MWSLREAPRELMNAAHKGRRADHRARAPLATAGFEEVAASSF